MHASIRFALTAVLVAATACLGGCAIFGIASVMGQSNEYQKLIEVPAQYPGLEGRTVAVIVEADMSVLYQHPTLIENVMFNTSQRIARYVEGARVMDTRAVLAWQYQTPQWSALPYGRIAEALGVDRVVFVDVYEFRLHPPGNSWLWEGVCAADVGIVERESYDPDSFVETFQVRSAFPTIQGVGRDSASKNQIETGVLSQFFQRLGWLFYLHEEPKYPDKYRPELG